jgi:hypothetical protein
MAHPSSAFTVTCDLTRKTYRVYLPSKSSCALLTSDDAGDIYPDCLFNGCGFCPYDLPDDIVPAAEAVYNTIMFRLNPLR